MNKKMKLLMRSVLMAVMMALLCSTAVLADEEDPGRFVKDTTINGIKVGGMTAEEAKALVGNAFAGSYTLTLKGKNRQTEVITGPEIGFVSNVPDEFQALLDKQNAGGRVTGPHARNSYELNITGTPNEEALRARVNALAMVSGSDVVKTTDAYISAYAEGQPFTIIPEVQGNELDVEQVISLVRGSVSNGLREINLAEWDCYKKVTVNSDNQQLKELCALMNQVKDMSITYTFGENTEVLEGSVITGWLTGSENGMIGVDRSKAAAYAASLAAKYDTAGSKRIFRTAGGKDVELTGPYGWRLNQDAETDALIGMIRTGQTQTREPQYAKSAVSRNGSDWGNTYVEIDLTGQHVYMYKDGVQVWDAPCVTGNVSKNYTTPPGIYSLTYKERDRVLRGAKQADGTYEYESPVDYWMPFNGGIGLHDADWRSKFGGTIYQYGGSHGCINLPPNKTKALYDMVYTGIPVICYN